MCHWRLTVARYHARSTSSTMYQVALSGFEVDRLYKGAINSHCGFCGVLQFHVESINFCHSGKVFIHMSLLYKLFLPQYTPYLLQTQKKDIISMSTFAYTTVLFHLHLWGQISTFHLAMVHNATASMVTFTIDLVLSTLTRNKGGSIHSSTSWRAIRQ